MESNKKTFCAEVQAGRIGKSPLERGFFTAECVKSEVRKFVGFSRKADGFLNSRQLAGQTLITILF